MKWPEEPQRLPARRAEHPHRPARRRRLRRRRHLRRRGPHADTEQAGRRGHPLQRLPHHLDLLADPGGPADRAQPHPGRLRHHRRARGRLRRLHRRHPEDRRHHRRGPQGVRLPHLRLRQMAQHAGHRDDRDGPQGPLAQRLRVRVLLRLPRRRDLAVGAAPHRELRLTSSRRTTTRVPPHRGHGRQGPRLARRPPGLRAGQALPHVLGARRRARSAPRLPGSGRTSTRASSTTAGTPTASASTSASWRWASSRPAPSSRRATETLASWDSIPPDQRAFQTRLMEIFAGFVEHTDAPGRPTRRGAGEARPARQHADLLHLRRQRLERRRPAGLDQRAARPEQHPQHRRAADRGARTDRRPRRAGLAQDRQHVPRRLGLGRRHAVQGHQAPRRLLRRHPQPDGRLLAQGHQAGQRPCARSSTTWWTSPRRSTRSSASRRRRSSTATSRCRWTASAWPTPSPTPTAETRKQVQFFDNNGSRGIYQDGWFACTFGPFMPWDTPGSVKRIAELGLRRGRLGALRSPQRLLAGQRPGRPSTPRSSRS